MTHSLAAVHSLTVSVHIYFGTKLCPTHSSYSAELLSKVQDDTDKQRSPQVGQSEEL